MKKFFVLTIVVLLMLSMSACGSKAERPEEACKWYERTNKCITRLNGDIPVSWKDAVVYAEGGSGPADPAGEFESDVTAVNHDQRLIVENEQLDVRSCFPEVSDDVWQQIVDWTNKWSAASPSRIEWQVNESRCSFVFPGNITDPIGEEDYEQLLKIFDKTGYTNTWFVAGEEGQEFGRKTYEEIVSVDSTFNRLHIYGPTLSKMPVLDSD
jgi:hypothetical protein